MEVVMLTQDINSLFSSLGCPVGDDYIVGDDCQATLEEILKRLTKEDKYVRGFRRLIANSQVVKKDLLPLFYNVKNDYKILDLIAEILENLMIPVECLFPIDIMIREDAGRSTICQLNWLLTACKEAFLKPCSTKCVIDYVKLILKKEQPLTMEGCRSINMCLTMLRNLLHIPEVRGGAPGGGASHQNQIIWNLFTQHMDKVLIQLMTGVNRAMWSLTLVQLISLLYKDQHSNTIYKLINTWCNTELSESSEDNESNTSPQDQGSGDSSSMVTSDPTSDSSDSDHHKSISKSEPDNKHPPHPKQASTQAQNRMTEILANGVGRKAQVAMRNKHGKSSKTTHSNKHRQLDHSHSLELHSSSKVMRGVGWSSESGLGSSDSGFGSISCNTKMECGSPELSECNYSLQNQETISTSSNEDKEPSRFGKKKPVHQKTLHMIQKSCYNNGKIPQSTQARKDLCRRKLVKRSKMRTMSIKTFLNHTPSEEDISLLMREFTVDFLLKGYRYLVAELKVIILSKKAVEMDTSHFTWLIMFFLRFATQLELDLELVSPVLSYDIIAYLTYEGVTLCEELEVTKLQVGENLTKILGKLYLAVASLKEILIAIEMYKKVSHLSLADKEYFKILQEKIASTNDVKNLFLLLLRHFDPQVQSHQFLQDVVVANHYLLILIENCPQTSKLAVAEHIKQFATEDVMKQYGVLLACYEDNGEMVNDCIFTMMHHVAGDLEKVSILFQPSILKSFTRILETDFQISDNWSDLMEYVVQKCLKSKQKSAPVSSVSFDAHVMKPFDQSPWEIAPVSMEESIAEQQSVKDTVVELFMDVPDSVFLDDRWSKQEIESLCWYFPQSMEEADTVGHISELFMENFGQTKNRLEIIQNLFKQGLIQDEEYKCLLDGEPSTNIPATIQTNGSEVDILEGIQVILDYLHGENCGFFVKWLQDCLLEACYARLVVDNQQQPQYDLIEPVTYFFTLMNQAVPLVTWNQDLWKVMQLEPSIWLLSALNFHLPTRAGQAKIFARIPVDWSADHLYVAALILGPLDSSRVKFDPANLQVIKHSGQSHTPMESTSSSTTSFRASSSLFGFFIGSSSSDWLQKVMQLKPSSKVVPLEDKHERMSMISGDERDWDLTSMCVSDEGARHEDTVITLSLS